MGKEKNAKEILGFDDTWFLILGIPVLSFCIPFLFFKATLADGLMAYLPEWGVSMMYTVAYWMACRTIFIHFRRRFPGQQETKKRVLYISGAVLLAYAVVNWSLDYVHVFMGILPREGVTDFDYTVGTLMIVALVGTLYESAFLYDRWKKSILETEQLKRENIESQLEGLKSQVNPHFLFNSLNTLTYIIPEDPDKAVHFVQKLSKVYRYILEIRDKKLISLEEELSFLHAYLFLVLERFGDNLRAILTIKEVPDDMDVSLFTIRNIDYSGYRAIPTPNNTTFREVENSSHFRLIRKDELRKAISLYYDKYQQNYEILSTPLGRYQVLIAETFPGQIYMKSFLGEEELSPEVVRNWLRKFISHPEFEAAINAEFYYTTDQIFWINRILEQGADLEQSLKAAYK